MSRSRHPFLYEINTMTFLNRLSEENGRPVGLKDVPLDFWNDLKAQGFSYVWMMGMWQRSGASRDFSLTLPELRQEYSQILGEWTEEDVTGSPYAIGEYQPDPRFGTVADLKRLKETLNRLGLKLILDFVPNHMGLDHPWSRTHPERFVYCFPEALNDHHQNDFTKISSRLYVAHGRDPYFAPWRDTLQLNYASMDTRAGLTDLLLKIAPFCDGLRCDVAMLVINRIFQKTWAHVLHDIKMPDGEFWVEAIRSVKARFSEFVFMAEAYWDMEWELQQMGFDYTYDKKFYDRLVHSSAQSIREHLWADEVYQRKSVRFLENHDEPRVMTTMPLERSQAAAVIASTVRGMKLIFDGQHEGKMVRIPVHLGVEPKEAVNGEVKAFYQKLMSFVRDPVFSQGEWTLLDVQEAWEKNKSYQNILAWLWQDGDESRIIVVNFSGTDSQARIVFPSVSAETETISLHDQYSGITYSRNVVELQQRGLFVALNAWKSHWFSCSQACFKAVTPATAIR